jgi:hypothetical protein
MVRFVIGLTLLLLAAALPLRAPARSEPLVDDGGSLLERQLEQLLHHRQPTEEEQERLRQDEENRKRLQENALELERMLAERRASLAEIGPTFAITSVDGWLSDLGPHLRAACLVGAAGKLYLYDVTKDAAARMTGVVDQREFSKAVDLAKSVGHVEWQPQPATYDFGVIAWTMSMEGRRTLLQMGGDYVGALPDPRIGELVRLIDGWCPYAPEIRSRLELPAFEGRPRPPY